MNKAQFKKEILKGLERHLEEYKDYLNEMADALDPERTNGSEVTLKLDGIVSQIVSTLGLVRITLRK